VGFTVLKDWQGKPPTIISQAGIVFISSSFISAQTAEQEFNRRLAEINTPVNQAIIQINPGCPQALALQESLNALLAVRDQEGWPANVVWPGQNEA
jgi:hypothetical protein